MKIFLTSIAIIFFAGSCMHKKIVYLQDKTETTNQNVEYQNVPPEYTVKKGDLLYIDIFSTNKEITEIFSTSNTVNTNSQGSGMNYYYLYGYMVNDSGFIEVPIIGKIQVEGKLIKQIEEIVQQKTNEHLNNALVKVRLVSYYVTFLGEVTSQGKITVLQNNLNILDGLAMAGGITDYGNKKKVLLIRQTKNGAITYRLDLTDRNLLKQEKYYLLPNDMVIVEPLKNKAFQLGVRDYTLILTTITSTLTLIILVTNSFK
ncbi:MAG: polysaccharide biosynthesis/export family protein [Bacteroidales bacterium]